MTEWQTNLFSSWFSVVGKKYFLQLITQANYCSLALISYTHLTSNYLYCMLFYQPLGNHKKLDFFLNKLDFPEVEIEVTKCSFKKKKMIKKLNWIIIYLSKKKKKLRTCATFITRENIIFSDIVRTYYFWTESIYAMAWFWGKMDAHSKLVHVWI